MNTLKHVNAINADLCFHIDKCLVSAHSNCSIYHVNLPNNWLAWLLTHTNKNSHVRHITKGWARVGAVTRKFKCLKVLFDSTLNHYLIHVWLPHQNIVFLGYTKDVDQQFLLQLCINMPLGNLK